MIGTVVERHVESYKLDIGGPEVSAHSTRQCTAAIALVLKTSTHIPLCYLCRCVAGYAARAVL